MAPTDDLHDHVVDEEEDDDALFFADITLDLQEAHDIAGTPEPTRKTIVNMESSKSSSSSSRRMIPRMPSIPDTYAYNNSNDEDVTMEFALKPQEDEEEEKDSKLLTTTAIKGPSIHHYPHHHKNRRSISSTARRWPRDVQWAFAFCIIVPLSLILPIIFGRQHSLMPSSSSSQEPNKLVPELWMATAPAPRLATLHTLLWGYLASLLLCRLLYRTHGGGEGDDARHVASQILLLAAPISVSTYLLLVIVMYVSLPKAWPFLFIPLWYLARDVFLFRTWKVTATTPGGRQAFFQALTCMTMDILSRSLRRTSFYRIVSLLVLIQLFIIGCWRTALLAALQTQSPFWILIAGVGGKWATGTVARLLSLIAAGGIHRWFAEQEALVQETNVQRNDTNGGNGYNEYDEDDDEDDMIELPRVSDKNGYSQAFVDDPDDIPEAYRTADASAYRSALPADEGMDFDFEEEEEDDAAAVYSSTSIPSGGGGGTTSSSDYTSTSVVKQLLWQGLTRSFGSVVRCGLLGGVAQFVWSQIRKVDSARATFGNLRGMPIAYSTPPSGVGHMDGIDDDDDTTNNNSNHILSVWNQTLMKGNVMARDFVRNNSDMAMSHVAAFSKSYQRAAQDVAILIDESGTCDTVVVVGVPRWYIVCMILPVVFRGSAESLLTKCKVV